MKKFNELSYKQLKLKFNPNNFNFNTTDELDPIKVGIGQERGIKALEFGLNVDINGYNLYLEGPSGVGKTMYTKNYLDQIAKKKKVPCDWCYLYNFVNPNEPVALSLPAGQGKVFKDTMDKFIKDIQKDLKNTFNNDDFEKEKALIKQEFDEKKENLMNELNAHSEKHGFRVKSANNGIYMMPIVDGKTIEEEEFDKLDDKTKQEYEEKSSIVQNNIMVAIAEIKAIQEASDKKINDWQSNVALITINGHINLIKSNFKRNKKISTFLDGVKDDILRHLDVFLGNDKSKNKDNPPPPAARATDQQSKPWLNYRVNLFLDNSNTVGAPVIMDSNYSYNNIFGRLEYENYYGSLKTDYTMLKPGLLHMANGGYIIFQASDLLTNSICYDNLKKILRTKQLGIDNYIDSHSSMVMISLKPEPIPLDLKVILIGDENIYQTLLSIDEDFRKLFKIKVEFSDDAPLTNDNANKLASVVTGFCQKEDLPPLDKEAMAKIIEYASRLSDNQEKLSTKFGDITQIVGEAGTWAKLKKNKVVTADIIDETLFEKKNRLLKYDSKYMDMIKDKTLLIDTTGFKVGQINGLTVMSIGDYTFGTPTRITATTYIGKSGIVNVEREVELSGSTHSKGILILTGYLGTLFAQEFPLSLTANICFEQLYNGVDGDSASSTELYALLSSLSEVPINQSIAVTGSVNQKGDIQPIGGINEKIEGFYKTCKSQGLTGSQGVMIPKLNEKNLNLSNEVVEAVKRHEFHIYSISTIEEGIECLTGVPAGKRDSNGRFPAGTINYLVYEKLKKYAKLSKDNK